jgi:hypothetical protein
MAPLSASPAPATPDRQVRRVPTLMDAPGGSSVDRIALRRELIEVATDLLQMLEAVSEADWQRPVNHQNATLGELIYELYEAVLPSFPHEVEHARQRRDYRNPLFLLRPVSRFAGRLRRRIGARRTSAAALRGRFAEDLRSALATFDAIPAEEWHHGAAFYGQGFHSIVDLIRRKRTLMARHSGLSRGS